MANQDDIQKILSEAVTNEEFRSQLIENPVDAVQEAGYTLTDEQIEQLQQLESEKVESMLENVEDRLQQGVSGVPRSVYRSESLMPTHKVCIPRAEKVIGFSLTPPLIDRRPSGPRDLSFT